MKFVLRSAAETFDLGVRFGKVAAGGEVLALSGPLGSGKTLFAKGIGAGLGLPADAVHSPTFVLMAVHAGGRLPYVHADGYRLTDGAAFAREGWEDLIHAVRAVEWAERIRGILPEDAIWVRFTVIG